MANMELTSASRRKLDQSQRGIVCWNWFKSNIRMPKLIVALGNHDPIFLRPTIELLELLRANGAHFQVVSSEIAFGVQKWMDVERGGCRPASQLPELEN